MPAGVRCVYVLLAGLPGTGKSTIARALAERLPAIVLNKDAVRAVLFPGEATDYSEAQNDICMQAMLTAAAYLAKRDETRFVLFDGRTFSRSSHVDQVVCSATDLGAAWRILHCWCADEIALARIEQSHAGHPARDRNRELYEALKGRFEPIERAHLSIDTGRTLELCVQECVEYLELSFI